MPKITVTNVKPTTFDEWFGIMVDFVWADGFNYLDHTVRGRAELSRWCDDHPKQDIPPDMWPNEVKLKDDIVQQVLASPAWQQFWQTEHRVTCQEYKDGPNRIVKLYQPLAADFDEWTFGQTGSWVGAKDR